MARRLALRTVAAGVGSLALAAGLARDAGAQTRLDVVPSLGVSETWSDNVELRSRDTESGLTTNVTPRIRIGATGGKLTGGAEYGLNVRIEHFEGGKTALEHDASADLTYLATPRWRLTLREDFRFTPDPTESLAFVTPEGAAFRRFEEAARQPGVDILDLRILRVRENELRNRLALGTRYDLTPRWTVGADAIWLMQDSSDEVFGEDSQTVGGRLRANYRLTPTDELSLSGGADRTDFERAPDATVLRAEAGWNRQLRQTLRLELAGGYARVTSDETAAAAARDDNEFTGRVALAGDLPQGGWDLVLAREVFAGTGTGDVSRRIVAEAGLVRALAAELDGSLRARYLRSSSVRGFGAEGETFEGIAGLSYRFLRWAAARLLYRHRRIEPLGPGPSVDENSVLVGVELRWPLRELPGLRPMP